MPQPYTVVNPVTGAAVLTVDGAGNVYAAGQVQGLAAPGSGALGPAPWPAPNSDALLTGELVMHRQLAQTAPQLVGGQVWFTYFTAARTATAVSIATASGATAGAALTTAQVGLYSSDPSGDLTLLAASAVNVAGLWSATFTQYTTPLTQPVARTAGQRYALAVLAAGTTMPTVQGCFCTFTGVTPPVATLLAGQAALPAFILATALAGSAPGCLQGILAP